MFKKLVLSTTLRRRVSWVITVVLLLPFAVFFTMRAPLKGPGGDAGMLFGTRIPWDTFDEHQFWVRRQLASKLSDMPDLLEPMVTQTTWERLMLLEEAKHRYLRLDAGAVAHLIQRIPAFQEQGRFVPARYFQYLSASGMSPQRFEELLRDDLLIARLVDTVRAGVTVSDDEVRQALQRREERLTGTLFLFEPATFREAAAGTITEADLRTEYDAHPEAVQIPAQIVVDTAGALRETIARSVQISDEEAKTFFLDHPERFTTPDGKARPFEEIREDARRQAAEARVRTQLTDIRLDLQEDLEAHTPFEEIAAARQLVTRQVGPIPAGTAATPALAPEILQAVATLREGELSRVVDTAGGVFLARIARRMPARGMPFEEARDRVRQRLVEARAREQAKRAADALAERMRAQQSAGWRFEEIALTDGGRLGRPVVLTRSGPVEPIGEAPALVAAAFQAPLGTLTPVLDTPGGWAMVRPESRTLPGPTLAAAARETLRQDVLRKKQTERVEAWLADVRERAHMQSFLAARQ